LELELNKVWKYKCEGVFARALISKEGLDFEYINENIVDQKHLKFLDLIEEYEKISRNYPYL